jgi:hypothetical protein
MAPTTPVKAAVGLLDAVKDKRLLAFRPHPAQALLLLYIETNQLVVAAAGRRFGKSRAAAAGALWNLLLRPELDALISPGEARYAVSVANSQAQARIFVEHAASIVKGSPTLRRELLEEQLDRLVFRGGRVLAAFPCSSKSGRGWPISYLVLDEFAHHFEDPGGEGGPATARRVWAAMTPSVAQFGPKGRIVVVSTPAGDSGLFARLHHQASTGELPHAVAFQAPTSANPAVDREWLAQQEAALGADDYRREFGAEFIAGGAGFFDTEAVRACVAPWREADPFHAATRWEAGFDAGFERDPSALAIVGRDRMDASRLIVGYTQRWIPPRRTVSKTRQETTSWMAQVFDEVAAVCKGYGVARLVPDSHLGATVRSELSRRNVHVAEQRIVQGAERLLAWRNLRARVNLGRIVLPDDPQLVTELLRIRTSADGAGIVKPRTGDSHCDLADALVNAVASIDSSGAASGGVLATVGWDDDGGLDRGLVVGDEFGRNDPLTYDEAL